MKKVLLGENDLLELSPEITSGAGRIHGESLGIISINTFGDKKDVLVVRGHTNSNPQDRIFAFEVAHYFYPNDSYATYASQEKDTDIDTLAAFLDENRDRLSSSEALLEVVYDFPKYEGQSEVSDVMSSGSEEVETVVPVIKSELFRRLKDGEFNQHRGGRGH